MNIRPARSVDAPAIAALLAARVPDTCYADRDEVDVPYARKMFAYAAQRHGNTNEGGMFLMVAEDEHGVAAFCMASLGRVYGVGKKLCATDNYLLGRKGCPARVLISLFEMYVGWASTNPRVIEVGASWSDALPGSDKWTPIFKRMGFEPCAQSFRRLNVARKQAEAA